MAPTIAELTAQRDKMMDEGATFADLAQINARIRDLAMGAAGTDANRPEETNTDAVPETERPADWTPPAADATDEVWETALMHLPPSTPEQVTYAQTLVRGLGHMAPGGQVEVDKTLTWVAAGARREAELAGVILELLIMADENRAVRPLDEAPELPNGRYLLDGNMWDVSRKTVGKVTGIVLRPIEEDGTTLGPAIGYRRTKREIITALTADPATAARAYGKRYERCGFCEEPTVGVAAQLAIHAECLLLA